MSSSKAEHGHRQLLSGVNLVSEHSGYACQLTLLERAVLMTAGLRPFRGDQSDDNDGSLNVRFQ